ncbi:MAG: primosomal protein N' [Bacteroidota bacterium]
MVQLDLNNPSDEGIETFFVDVILPVPIPKLFTYRVPNELADLVQIGCRVVVQFGRKKILTGVIGEVHQNPPQVYEAKYLLDLLDEEPAVNHLQIKLFRWMADYYMCTIGEVLNVALPSGLKLSSESRVQLNPSFSPEDTDVPLSGKEQLLIESLQRQGTLSYSEISRILGQKTIYSILKSLVIKEAIIIFEEVKEKFKPKKEKRLRLSPTYVGNESMLESLFEQLQKNPKQEDILLRYLQEVPVYQQPELNTEGVSKKLLTENGLSPSSLKTLTNKGILEEFEVIISRFAEHEEGESQITLNEEQHKAKEQILGHFKENKPVLLHGITGSGKTEIYIELIKEAIEGGNQVLYLLPEIALTTQIVNRLRQVFGSNMGVYHSKFSDNERVEVWKGILEGRFDFVVGVRSSIFLPFDNLGLIIVDEEHETSYKQFEPAPRYNARDIALLLNKMHGAKILLGSATPSIESYFLAETGRYGLVELLSRFGGAVLPETKLADLLSESKRKTIKGEFSSMLLSALENVMNKGEQAIIFQNRRGYSPYVTCEDCGWVPKCPHCAVSLTYHQYKKELNCHYCGYKEPIINTCEACGSHRIKSVGYGTEKLEENLELLLPNARIQRMDLDTTRRKKSYETIIEDFEVGNTDILVGTQMVSKGLDFDRVSLVGVLDTDRMMHFPDFRSFERTFQLITQVSGRAGRRDKRGLVIIQTKDLDSPLLHDIITNNYQRFYRREISEREKYNYPPFHRLIKVIVKHKDQNVCDVSARKLANLLREQLGRTRVLGPEEPLVSRIRNQYLMELLIKLERDKINLAKVKSIISDMILELSQEKEIKSTSYVVDVDPY